MRHSADPSGRTPHFESAGPVTESMRHPVETVMTSIALLPSGLFRVRVTTLVTRAGCEWGGADADERSGGFVDLDEGVVVDCLVEVDGRAVDVVASGLERARPGEADRSVGDPAVRAPSVRDVAKTSSPPSG